MPIDFGPQGVSRRLPPTSAAFCARDARREALRQLDALAKKMEKKSRVGELAKLAGTAETTVEEWLAVLARCFQLQDGLMVLELDRVLDSSPGDLDSHRAAVRAAREKRREVISDSTAQLLTRMDAAASGANEQVLLHPLKARKVVRSGNEVASDVVVFHDQLGIEANRVAIEAKSWRDAAVDARDDTLDFGERGAKAVARFSVKTFDGAKDGTEKILESVAERLAKRRASNQHTAQPEPVISADEPKE